jgi:hypothetical protein
MVEIGRRIVGEIERRGEGVSFEIVNVMQAVRRFR